MKPYAVVTFVNDSSTELESSSEVPSCWLSEDLKQCWWPITKNVGPHITKKSVPDKYNERKWQLHDIKFIGFYDKLTNNHIKLLY